MNAGDDVKVNAVHQPVIEKVGGLCAESAESREKPRACQQFFGRGCKLPIKYKLQQFHPGSLTGLAPSWG